MKAKKKANGFLLVLGVIKIEKSNTYDITTQKTCNLLNFHYVELQDERIMMIIVKSNTKTMNI